MKRSSGVRMCATAAVGALSLALVTGCSDSGKKDSGSDGSTSAKGSGSGTAAKALSAAELKKLVIADGQVPGYKVGAVEGGVPAKSKLKVADAACQPAAYATYGQSPADAAAQTSSEATQKAKVPQITVVTLSSYDGDGAAQALKAVSDSVKACAGGFTVKPDGDPMHITKVAEEKPSGTGEASVAFAVTSLADGEPGAMHIEVVQHGNTLASYSTVDIGAIMAKKPYTVPAPVVEAQQARLK